jgi:hypothetical protein
MHHDPRSSHGMAATREQDSVDKEKSLEKSEFNSFSQDGIHNRPLITP